MAGTQRAVEMMKEVVLEGWTETWKHRVLEAVLGNVH